MSTTATHPGDRRQFLRSAFHAPVKITANGRSHVTNLLDVSLKGALVKQVDDWMVHAGQKCLFHLELAPGVVVTMATTVAHVEGAFIGLHCDSIDLESITHLRNMVELNADDPSLLERDLATLASRRGRSG
ncbi:MAG: hypothetical protein RL710_2670 [Pseudomonadota bacterium]|jgi:hypothetical protein